MPDEPKRPVSHLRLAAENDQSDIDCQYALKRIEQPLKKLMANLLRVARGAGEPDAIVLQCDDVVSSFQEVQRVCGRWPDAHEISKIFNLKPQITGDEFYDGFEIMLGGAVRMAAARILGQMTHETRARSEMMDGFLQVEKARDRNRRERIASEKSSAAKTKAGRRRKPRSPKDETIL
ncbi:hypothetical protein [Oricola indica]|uniref:hypothetical protein n=1 Tax=Oricola indica TaxID=2872591 RepID=UPI003CCC3648